MKRRRRKRRWNRKEIAGGRDGEEEKGKEET